MCNEMFQFLLLESLFAIWPKTKTLNSHPHPGLSRHLGEGSTCLYSTPYDPIACI